MAVALQQQPRGPTLGSMGSYGGVTSASPVASTSNVFSVRRRSLNNSGPRKLLANGHVKFVPLNFHKPIFLPSHLAEFYHKQVELASITFSFHAVVGQILCKNFGENVDSDVFVRFTVDGWESHEDVDATFTTHHFGHARHDYYSCFSFKIDLSDLQLQQLKMRSFVQFAVCCRVGADEFWDNNGGANFCLAVAQ